MHGFSLSSYTPALQERIEEAAPRILRRLKLAPREAAFVYDLPARVVPLGETSLGTEYRCPSKGGHDGGYVVTALNDTGVSVYGRQFTCTCPAGERGIGCVHVESVALARSESLYRAVAQSDNVRAALDLIGEALSAQ